MAQRLVRRLCSACRRKTAPGTARRPDGFMPRQHWRAMGCDRCHEGYAGRHGLFHLLPAGSLPDSALAESGGQNTPAVYGRRAWPWWIGASPRRRNSDACWGNRHDRLLALSLACCYRRGRHPRGSPADNGERVGQASVNQSGSPAAERTGHRLFTGRILERQPIAGSDLAAGFAAGGRTAPEGKPASAGGRSSPRRLAVSAAFTQRQNRAGPYPVPGLHRLSHDFLTALLRSSGIRRAYRPVGSLLPPIGGS